MTRRIKRTGDFEVELRVTNDQFIRPPRDSQRNWIINRALKEFADELNELNEQASRFVEGQDFGELTDRTQGEPGDSEIMEDWQIPVMQQMAQSVAGRGGEILEVGFGRGIASTFLQELEIQSHTIIECNDSIVARFETWRQAWPQSDFRLLHGRWQDQIEQLAQYEGILFHTYPLDPDELLDHVTQSITFAQPFFPVASRHLKSGGAFSYFTNEIDSISRAHQRLLLQHFNSFSAQLVADLNIPNDTRDALWGDSMMLVTAIK